MIKIFSKTIILLMLLCFFSSYANSKSSEQFTFDNGVIVYGYQLNDVPNKFQKDECDKYVFADEKFTALVDGRYVAEGNNIIMVHDSCLFTKTGESILANGDLVEFYQTDTFNTSGNVVFRNVGKRYKRVYNEKMQLKNGQEFSVEEGYIPFGFFDDGSIIYENRD